MSWNIDHAWVAPAASGGEQSVFPFGGHARPREESPREICRVTGLNWAMAQQLHAAGLLSFDPGKTATLSLSQSTELRFLGVLVAGGCDMSMLRQMLTGLKKPYAYRIANIYYDWTQREWRPLLSSEDLRSHFLVWIDELVERSDDEELRMLRRTIESALRDLQYFTGRKAE